MKFYSLLLVSGFLSALSLFGSSPAWADYVKLLADNELAIQARVNLIREAKYEIVLEYFEVANDDFVWAGIALLQEAAIKRNVKVKLLVDSMFNRLDPAAIAALQRYSKGNFEIRAFNPTHRQRNPLALTYRNHEKLLVVDGAKMIIGGRNADINYFRRGSAKNKRDIDLFVTGQTALVARNYFLRLWNQNKMVLDPDIDHFSSNFLDDACGPYDSMPEHDCLAIKGDVLGKVGRAQQKINSILQDLNHGPISKEAQPTNVIFSNLIEVGHIEFLFNNPDLEMKNMTDKMSDRLFTWITSFKPTQMSMTTPFLYPSKAGFDMLRQLQEIGTEVRIISNSLAASQETLPYTAYSQIKSALINLGVNLYEYRGPELMHAKSITLKNSKDENALMIGSFNFDIRSADTNREIAVLISGKNADLVASQVNDVHRDYILPNSKGRSGSILVGTRGQRLNDEIVEREASEEKVEKSNGPDRWLLLVPAIRGAI